MYGISLNPKKSIFAVTEGKLMGHILSKEGIVIDPERIETIMRIQPPTNKRSYNISSGRSILLENLSQVLQKLCTPCS